MFAFAPILARFLSAIRAMSGVALRTFLVVSTLGMTSGCTLCRWTKSQEDLGVARQLTLRGAEAMQRGNAMEAERCFLDAIERHPQDERCHVLLAELRKRQGREIESTEHLQRAVAISGDDPNLLVTLGEQLFEQDSQDAAMRCVRKALRNDATSSAAWVLYARLLKQQQDGPDAIVAYHRALQIDPNQRSVAIELAQTYLEEGRLERCLSTLDSKALSVAESGGNGEPEYLRGLALARMERHADATLALADAERKGIRTPEVYYQLARSHHLSGYPASARLALAEAQKLAPYDNRVAELAAALDEPAQRMVRGKSPRGL